MEVVGGGGVGSSCVNFCYEEGMQRSIVCLVELLMVVEVVGGGGASGWGWGRLQAELTQLQLCMCSIS